MAVCSPCWSECLTCTARGRVRFSYFPGVGTRQPAHPSGMRLPPCNMPSRWHGTARCAPVVARRGCGTNSSSAGISPRVRGFSRVHGERLIPIHSFVRLSRALVARRSADCPQTTRLRVRLRGWCPQTWGASPMPAEWRDPHHSARRIAAVADKSRSPCSSSIVPSTRCWRHLHGSH